MMNWIHRMRTQMLQLLGRKHVVTILGIAALVAGGALAFVSLVPDIEPAGSRNAVGTVPAFSTRNETFIVDSGLTQAELQTGGCTILVTLLSPVEFIDYLETGRKPPHQLDCDHRIATFTYSLRGIVVENVGTSDQPYGVTATYFAVQQTRGWLALVSFPLLIVGSAVLLIRAFRRGVDRIQEEFRGRPPRKKQ